MFRLILTYAPKAKTRTDTTKTIQILESAEMTLRKDFPVIKN